MSDDAQKQDVKADSSAAETQDEQKADEQSVPFSRFKEVNDRLKEATNFVNWVRQTFDSPEELVELAKMKREGTKQEKKSASEQEEELTEAQKAAVRKLVRMSDANLAKVADLVEQGKLKVVDDEEAQEEDLVDETESELLKIIKEKKLPTSDAFLKQLGRQIMMEITSDPKLYKAWQRGKTESVARQAFSRLDEEFFSPLRTGKSVLQTKQDTAKLPNLPSGGTGVAEKPKSKTEGQGITKAVHDEAYRRLQEAARE